MLSTTVFEHEGIGYFLDQSDAGFDRYDIVEQRWMAPIDLVGISAAPTVSHVDDDGFYIAYGKSVYRYDLDGTNETHVINAEYNVESLHTDGDILFINHSTGLYARFISVSKATNTVIDTLESYVHSNHGSDIDTMSNRIFGRTTGVSPSDIVYTSYSDAGEFLSHNDSTYHGDYPGGSRVWVFDSGSKVVDSSGVIYSTALNYLGSFNSTVTDIDFVGGQVPIVLSGSEVTAYSQGLLPTGSTTVAGSPSDLFVNDENALLFSQQGSSWSVTVVPLSDLSAPEPGNAVDPQGLSFTPDKVEIAADGSVLLFSTQHQSVFRFDPVAQTWLDTIPLVGAPLYMAYSAVNDKIYLAYDSGLIRQVDLTAEDYPITPFATLPARPYGIATAGEFVFSSDASGAWESHYTFAPDGTMISAVDWNYGARQYTWSEANRKMYFFRDGTSPNDILWEEIGGNGAIGQKQDSPLHSSAGFTYPIRVSPDGSIAILGSGVIHDANTLARLTPSLGVSVTDVAWLGDQAYTVRNVAGISQLQAWANSTWGQTDIAQTMGTANSLVATDDGNLLAITIDSSGVPQLQIYDAQLDIVPRPAPVAVAGADVNIDIGNAAALNGSASYDLDNGPNALTYTWKLVEGPDTGLFDSPNSETTTFSATVEGEYLVRLTVSDGEYSASDTVLVTYRLNLPPVADASNSQTVGTAMRQAVQLWATASTDPNGDTLTYSWKITDAPEGSNWSLSSSSGAVSSIATDLPGEYRVELTASDGVLSATDILVVTFNANQTSTADASLSDRTAIASRQSARLDAGASADPDGDALTYNWEVISSPEPTGYAISAPTGPAPYFYAEIIGNYQVKLTVSDGLTSDEDVVSIDVVANQGPTADASKTLTTYSAGDSPIWLDGTASSDPDDTNLEYRWSLIATSNGTQPRITWSTRDTGRLEATEPGVYALELWVSDGLLSNTDYVLITIEGNLAPVADASGSDKNVPQGVLPQLDGRQSYDLNGDPLTYHWEVVASSAGDLPAVSDPAAPVTSLEATELGSYAVRLTVNDGLATGIDYAIVTVREVLQHPWTGDFDGDGWVNMTDFIMWRDMRGQSVAPYSYADATGDGLIDQADHSMWRERYGTNPGAQSTIALEPPTGSALLGDGDSQPTLAAALTTMFAIELEEDGGNRIYPLSANNAERFYQTAIDAALLLLNDPLIDAEAFQTESNWRPQDHRDYGELGDGSELKITLKE